MSRCTSLALLGLLSLLPLSEARAHCGACGTGGSSGRGAGHHRQHRHHQAPKSTRVTSAAVKAPSGPAVVGQPAPAFQLLDAQGEPVRLSDHAGKTVVLEWTNPDCPYVKRHYAAGTMKKLAAKWADEDVVWLTINSTHYQGRDENQSFVAAHDLAQPVLSDPSGRVGRAYGARTTPHMFVIAPTGELAYSGAIDDDRYGDGENPINFVDAALRDLSADREVAQPETAPYGCSVKYAR